jgi:hypothetical protein
MESNELVLAFGVNRVQRAVTFQADSEESSGIERIRLCSCDRAWLADSPGSFRFAVPVSLHQVSRKVLVQCFLDEFTVLVNEKHQGVVGQLRGPIQNQQE